MLAVELVAENDTQTALVRLKTDASGNLAVSGGGGGGGNLATAAKGATAAGNPTSTTASADRQLLDVTLRDTSGAPVAVGGGTQYADGAARGTATGTIAMGDDGTNIQSIKTDSSGVLAIQDNGGSITVDGTITANAGTNLNTSALALETTQSAQSTLIGAVTETAPASDTASSGLNGRLQRIAQRLSSIIALLPGSLGQKTMANSLAVTVASDQTVIPISDNAGTLTVDAPVATPVFVRLSDGASAISTLPVSLASTTVTGTTATKEIRSATNTTATVAGSATVVTLIASNANRLGATVYNDSSALLYVKLGASASLTDYTVVLAPLTSSVGGYYEAPYGYTGIITGIWASATGSARVGELT